MKSKTSTSRAAPKLLPAEVLQIVIEKTDASVSRKPGAKYAKELPIGKYSLRLKVIALKETVYIPASIGTGRVSTGFVYYIEGTEKGKGEAEISCRGEGVATITSGSISYWKISPGKTAFIKIYVQVTGSRVGQYKVVVSRINYKLNPNDLRYTRYLLEMSTGTLELRK